jgi:hypothetical protein
MAIEGTANFGQGLFRNAPNAVTKPRSGYRSNLLTERFAGSFQTPFTRLNPDLERKHSGNLARHRDDSNSRA